MVSQIKCPNCLKVGPPDEFRKPTSDEVQEQLSRGAARELIEYWIEKSLRCPSCGYIITDNYYQPQGDKDVSLFSKDGLAPAENCSICKENIETYLYTHRFPYVFNLKEGESVEISAFVCPWCTAERFKEIARNENGSIIYDNAEEEVFFGIVDFVITDSALKSLIKETLKSEK